MNLSIYVSNESLGVVSMHQTKTEGLVSARRLLNTDPEIKQLFVCDWMNRFDPVILRKKESNG